VLGAAPLAPLPGSTAAAGEGATEPGEDPLPVDVPPGALVFYDDTIRAPFLAGPFGVNGQDPCDRRARAGGTCSYALVFSSWGGIGIGRDDGFATDGYDRLVWAFNAHGQPLTSFAVALTALEDGRPIRAIPLDQARVDADLGDGWLRLSLPLSALNPDSVAVHEIVLRNVSGRDLGVAHLDDLWLVPGGLGVALPAGALASGR
jgi:hypothetical protein